MGQSILTADKKEIVLVGGGEKTDGKQGRRILPKLEHNGLTSAQGTERKPEKPRERKDADNER